MRDYQEKGNINGAVDSITVTKYGAGEFNSIAKELEAAVSTTGQTLAPAGGAGEILTQLAKAMAAYGSGGGAKYTDSGAADAYVLAKAGSFESPFDYFEGMEILFKPTNNTIGASDVTVNVVGLGVRPIVTETGSRASFKTGAFAYAVYNGTTDEFEQIKFGADMKEFPLPDAAQWDRTENRLPAPTNDYFGLSITGFALVKYDSSNVIDWTIAPSDVDASATEFVVPPSFNSAEDTMFVIASESTTIFHLGSVNYSTGVVTDLGSFTVATAHSASNFPGVFIRHGGANEIEFYYNSSPQRKVVLNATTAAIISEGIFSQKTGTEIYEGSPPTYAASYITSDETIAMTAIGSPGAEVVSSQFTIWRNGAKKRIQLTHKFSIVGQNGDVGAWPLLMFDGYVVLVANEVESQISIGGASSSQFETHGVYNRAEFDQWLKDIADYYGLPEV